jgi:hypothetical protein
MVKSKVFWGLCIGLLGTLATGLVSAQDITYVLTPVNDGIGDTLTGTITTDGNLGVLQGSDIVSFQFTYDLTAALTIDDKTPTPDFGTWGSSDPDASVVEALAGMPTGVDATAAALTSVGGGNLRFVASINTSLHPNYAYALFGDSFDEFGDTQGLEQTGIVINSSSYTIAKAPEIDPASAMSAITLLFSGVAVLSARKRA